MTSVRSAGKFISSVRLLEPLRGREAFRLVRTKGTIFEGKFLKFYHLCRTDEPGPFLVAVNVNKRHGVAAWRNRVKRRIRESLRLSVRKHGETLRARQISFSVVIVYQGTKDKSLNRVRFADLQRDVEEFMNAIYFVC